MIQFLKNVYHVRILSWSMVKLLWDFRFMPIIATDRFPTFDAGYQFNKNGPVLIFFSKHSTKNERITAILHELGHFLDLSNKSYKWGCSKIQDHVWKKEKAAWGHAINLSKKYNIQFSKDMAISWLSTYRTKSARLENL